jgi:hypothetical protein
MAAFLQSLVRQSSIVELAIRAEEKYKCQVSKQACIAMLYCTPSLLLVFVSDNHTVSKI